MNRRHLINQLGVMGVQVIVLALCSCVLVGGVYLLTGENARGFLHWLTPVALLAAAILTSAVGDMLDARTGRDGGSLVMTFPQGPVAEEVSAIWRDFQLNHTLGSQVIVCDGAMGTELMRRDPGYGIPGVWWNIEHNDEIQRIHEEYIKAGAQIILTNTFGANRAKLDKEKEWRYSVQELNLAGVEAARAACAGKDVLTFGDIGPSGCEQELFYSNGNDSKMNDSLYEVFKTQAEVLSEAGVDAIWIEAVSYLREAVIAVKAASENTKVPVICTMTFRKPPPERPDDFRTFWGNTVSEVVDELKKAGASAVGSNCGEVIEEMPRLARNMRKQTDLALVFEMNAGMPQVVDEDSFEPIYPLNAHRFAEIMMEVVAAGGNIVGGCCGTRAEHIAAFRMRLKELFG